MSALPVIENWEPIGCRECGVPAGEPCRGTIGSALHALRRRAVSKACKFYAETIRQEPPVFVEPTDANLAECFRDTRPIVRAVEYEDIRRAFFGWCRLDGIAISDSQMALFSARETEA